MNTKNNNVFAESKEDRWEDAEAIGVDEIQDALKKLKKGKADCVDGI